MCVDKSPPIEVLYKRPQDAEKNHDAIVVLKGTSTLVTSASESERDIDDLKNANTRIGISLKWRHGLHHLQLTPIFGHLSVEFLN